VRAKAALASGVVALAATTGVLYAATSASAVKCPPPLDGPVTAGPYTVNVCEIPKIVPGCDPAPCPPTAIAPQE